MSLVHYHLNGYGFVAPKIHTFVCLLFHTILLAFFYYNEIPRVFFHFNMSILLYIIVLIFYYLKFTVRAGAIIVLRIP